jgi:hypothetical protein
VPKHGLYPGFKTLSKGRRKARRQFLRFPRGSLFAVAPEVHCLDIVGMVVPPRPAHSSRIHVVGHDVVVVGERHLANSALPVLLNYFRSSSFRISALERSSRYPRGWCGSSIRCTPSLLAPLPLNRLAAAARERPMNGAVLIATEFHRFLQDRFSVKGRWSISHVPANRSHPFRPLSDSVVP